ncbi:gliding motility-associated C-terminal domain-containing protein [Hymenobacter sp. 15J16-1T3B]|uniref:DUF7948 domain-containing protein n=1 Tax=Hymenobacter sp. 15J16-1T3B TaxID=2886941 RepID=UPI001D11492C|nr:gliding motility-associated C-terminal domain-containing protein [Hymenobacter sp. 15J16-1T3B]MCC3158894.1 gliding motility-associated C-terminal domain-containing protein [Hymenobacter sp. 15J16-1T3B]
MKHCLLLLLACSWCLLARAHEAPTAPFRFAPNRGQWPAQVHHAGAVPGGWLFLEGDAFTYHLRQSLACDAPADALQRGHAFRVRLLDAAPGAAAAEELQPQAGYHNYFLGDDPRHWAGEVPLYGAVRMRQLYPGVQMLWHSAGGQLEYDYELSPGARPERIRMRYEGLDGLRLLPDGRLELLTSLGPLTEQAPVAWQTTPDGQRRAVACRFRLAAPDVVGFELPAGYNPALPLTIDPTVVFATYAGSVTGMSANASALDVEGNVYFGGQSFGPSYPATTGAYQTTGRSGNMVLSKLSPDGQRLLYATFLGGNNTEYPLDLEVSPLGELHVLGTTTSNNFPTLSTAYDRSYNGLRDLTISRFSRTGGQLLGSTLLGGSADEAGNLSTLPGTLRLDADGNVLIGSTSLSTNFPTVNALKATKSSADSYDGVVAKLSPTLSQLLWASYLGGNGNDEVDDIRVAPGGTIYVCGSTASTNFPTTNGAYQPGQLGQGDGYVLRFSADGRTLLAGTLLGTTAYDLARYLAFDASGNVYVAGGTGGRYPVSAGVVSSAFHSSGNMFVHCLNSGLTQSVFSTSFGTGTLYPAGFTVGYCNALYLAAYARSTTAPTTPDAAERTGRGLYACTLTEGARALTYGSYYGTLSGSGQHQHPAAANEISPAGTLSYIECTSVPNFPVTPNVYARSMATQGGNDGAILKFDLTGAPNFRVAVSPATPSCAPTLVQFANATVGATRYRWTFGDGSPADTARAPRHLYANAGTYTAQLVAYRTLPCGVLTDSARITVAVRAGAAPEPLRRRYLDCTGAVGLTASAGPAVEFLWSDGSADRVLTVRQPGRYLLYRASPDSCFAPLEFEVLAAPTLLLPNVVTANEDQLNRTFVVPANLLGSRLRIFNRWGRLVYQSEDYQNDWGGQQQPAGTYYYDLKPRDCATVHKGWVELLR